MATTMLRSQWQEDGNIHLIDVEPGPLPEGWARLKVRACGICGSDLHRLKGHNFGPPTIPPHHAGPRAGRQHHRRLRLAAGRCLRGRAAHQLRDVRVLPGGPQDAVPRRQAHRHAGAGGRPGRLHRRAGEAALPDGRLACQTSRGLWPSPSRSACAPSTWPTCAATRTSWCSAPARWA